MDSGHIGVDESGKGDFFGPLVIAACYVGPEHLAEMEGVRDSKKLTDAACIKMAHAIQQSCPHSVIAIGPTKYNELYEKMRNLNKLLAWGHARAIENVLEAQPADLVISDQFAAGGTVVKERLMNLGRQVEFRSRVRAEADIAVAAASVLARAEFLKRLEELGRIAGMPLPKGAGDPVLVAGRKLVSAKGKGSLGEFAKLHFRTTEQLGG